jgi:hypothetical protein
MVYQSLVYISQYIPKLAADMKVPHIWDNNFINKFEREVLSGKGRMKKMRGNILIIVIIYVNNTYKVLFLCI